MLLSYYIAERDSDIFVRGFVIFMSMCACKKNKATIVAARLILDQFNCDPIKEVELGSGLMGPIK